METTILIERDWEPCCITNHSGLWMAEEKWFTANVAALRAGLLQARVPAPIPKERPSYTLFSEGIARIAIDGAMLKGGSKYGGTDSVGVRNAIRQARVDKDVQAIMIEVDSPGGTVAGTSELANDVRVTNASHRPVYVHIEDMGASAAYWVASQARRITATHTSEVGSIGTVAVVVDSSAGAEATGNVVHVVSTGEFKGAFVEGAKVTDEHLNHLRERVAELNGHFLRGVSAGRGMPIASVREAADGRVFLAAQAQRLGLIDAVGTLDDAYKYIRTDLRNTQRQRQQTSAKIAGARMRTNEGVDMIGYEG